MNRMIFQFLAVANAILYCSASKGSIKVHSKHRRQLAGKSSKTGLNDHVLSVDIVDTKYSSKSIKEYHVDVAVSSKSSKLPNANGTDSKPNLFEHVNDDTAETKTNSKSAKSKASKSAKMNGGTSNLFEHDSAATSDSPSQMPSALSIGTESTSLTEEQQSTMADSLPPTVSVEYVPAPTDGPLLSDAIITPALSPVPISNYNIQAKTPKGEESFLFDNADKSSENHTPWTATNTATDGHSTKTHNGNNNIVLEYGLVSAAVVFILATAALIATRRTAVIEERRKSLVNMETGSVALDELSSI
jgi:hypothetical protein